MAYLDMTLRQLFNCLRGFNDLEAERSRVSYERTRWSTVMLMNSTGNYKRTIKVQNVPFPWEDNFTKGYDKDERKRIQELSDKIFPKRLDGE